MLLRRDRSAGVYSVSSAYLRQPKLQILLCPRRQIPRIARRCQLWLHGPRHPQTSVKHNGGDCQKIRPSRNTSLVEKGPTPSQLSCRHASYHPTAREPSGVPFHQVLAALTFRSTMTRQTLCHLSLRCHRCVRIMTDQGAFRSRFQGRLGYIIIHWTLQTFLL